MNKPLLRIIMGVRSPVTEGVVEMALCATVRKEIRVLVVDDHERFRHGLCSVLSRAEDMNVLGDIATSGAEQKSLDLQPDVVLLGMNTGSLSEASVMRRIKQVSPHSRIVLLTILEPSEEWLRRVSNEVTGYLTKNVSPSVLLDVVRLLVTDELCV